MKDIQVCFAVQATLYSGICHALSNFGDTILIKVILGFLLADSNNIS